MQNRRAFFKTMIRGGIFTSLTVLSGVLIRRWSESEDCQKNFACNNCGLSNRCQLPEADRYRLDAARSPKVNTSDGKTRR
ncbi:MAG: hypothetical protein Q8M08_11190 [Bacteroidales bacterium]|nr:hypothetical protein [Bacteroidales bacterium]